ANDFFLSHFGRTCPQCGTKSITFNLHFVFSLNPQPNQFDVWAILAHEFGHTLGLAHLGPGAVCQNEMFQAPHCSQTPDRNTMWNPVWDGETCERERDVTGF